MSDVILNPDDLSFMKRVIYALEAGGTPEERWAAHQWAEVLIWYQIQHAADSDPLVRSCPQCEGLGTIRLTPADIWPYGQTLLRALRGGEWRGSSELPMHPSGNASTRTQALKGLAARGLIEKGEPSYSESGGTEQTWRLTALGAALVREMTGTAS